MGDAFEQLTKLYFQIDPIYRSKYDNVWLLEDVPTKVLEGLVGEIFLAQEGNHLEII